MAASLVSQNFRAPGVTDSVNVGANGRVVLAAVAGEGYSVVLQMRQGESWVTVGAFNDDYHNPGQANATPSNPSNYTATHLPAGAAVRGNVLIVRGASASANVTLGLVT